MSFASIAELSFPSGLPRAADWRRVGRIAGGALGTAVQSAAMAGVLWLIVAAPGLLG